MLFSGSVGTLLTLLSECECLGVGLQDDLLGKSIYNIIHVGDHAQFSNSLVPMSMSLGKYMRTANIDT